MNEKAVQANVIPIADAARAGRKVRSTPKGRSVDPEALSEVRALLGDDPRRADLLIEYLHRIQDRYGCISSAHIVALAAEMKLAMTEVYEVATFYHHFDVVKESDPRPPSLTVRVCDSLACEMAGAGELLARLAGSAGQDVRVVSVPAARVSQVRDWIGALDVSACAGLAAKALAVSSAPEAWELVERADLS